MALATALLAVCPPCWLCALCGLPSVRVCPLWPTAALGGWLSAHCAACILDACDPGRPLLHGRAGHRQRRPRPGSSGAAHPRAVCGWGGGRWAGVWGGVRREVGAWGTWGMGVGHVSREGHVWGARLPACLPAALCASVLATPGLVMPRSIGQALVTASPPAGIAAAAGQRWRWPGKGWEC